MIHEDDVKRALELLGEMKQALDAFDPGMGSLWNGTSSRHWVDEANRGQRIAELAQEYEALCSSLAEQAGRQL